VRPAAPLAGPTRQEESDLTDPTEPERARGGKYLLTLSLSALGIVYGVIGTSPVFALRV
jgi:K+ transporter